MTLALEGLVEGRLSRFVLDDGRYRIGRVSFNDIHLSLRDISREHAEMIVVEGRVELRDLGSRNGTFLNGERVHDTVEVRAGQVIRFSDIEFKLVEEVVRDWRNGLRSAPLSLSEVVRSSPLVPVLGRHSTGKDDSAAAGSGSGSSAAGQATERLLDAVVRAGRLCVVPRSPVDSAQEMCELIHELVHSRRAAVLLSVFPDRNPHLLAMHPAGAEPAGELLLSEREWDHLATERRPLVLERMQPDGSGGFPEQEVQAARACAKAPAQALAIPLLDRGRCHGALYVERVVTAPEYTVPELDALIHLSVLLSLQLTDARLFQEQRSVIRLRQEVSLAARIQNRMLGRTRGTLRGYEALARQIPCFEVGGDIYDITILEDGRMVLVLGDVVGKGMGAALLMSNVLAALRVLYPEVADPGEIVTRLHQEMVQASEPSHFVTLFFGVLDPNRNQLRYVNAGHCPPIVMRPDGELLFVQSDGLPVGALPDASYRTHSVELPPDSLLCVFSDGIPEAEGQEGFYWEERLVDLLRRGFNLALEKVVEEVIGDLRLFVGEEPLQDDVTILLLRKSDPAT